HSASIVGLGLVVIGGGPAGQKGAAQTAYFGHKTIVIEVYRELGSTCINWGHSRLQNSARIIPVSLRLPYSPTRRRLGRAIQGRDHRDRYSQGRFWQSSGKAL